MAAPCCCRRVSTSIMAPFLLLLLVLVAVSEVQASDLSKAGNDVEYLSTCLACLNPHLPSQPARKWCQTGKEDWEGYCTSSNATCSHTYRNIATCIGYDQVSQFTNCGNCTQSNNVWCRVRKGATSLVEGFCTRSTSSPVCSELITAPARCLPLTSYMSLPQCCNTHKKKWCPVGSSGYCLNYGDFCPVNQSVVSPCNGDPMDNPGTTDDSSDNNTDLPIVLSVVLVSFFFVMSCACCCYNVCENNRRNARAAAERSTDYSLMNEEEIDVSFDSLGSESSVDHTNPTPRFREIARMTEDELRSRLRELEVDPSWCQTKSDLVHLLYSVQASKDQADRMLVRQGDDSPALKKPSFPSGVWVGYFLHGPNRYNLRMKLDFENGFVTGRGHDRDGPYLLNGHYNDESLKIVLTKRYVEPRFGVYEYQGTRGTRLGQGIRGNWKKQAYDVSGNVSSEFDMFGYFHVWPETGFQDQPVVRGSFSLPLKASAVFETPPDRKSSPLGQMAEEDHKSVQGDVCVVCMDKGIDCVLLRCGHVCTCMECARQMHRCPICRRRIIEAVKIYMAS
eukprot:GILJ01004792.1.p1 GENE.GILJ01004792.1~~GILJ01004792.1.p1  ORF type:complete len:592 (-),score=28.53 GILJ01004792.1:118-1806(-)